VFFKVAEPFYISNTIYKNLFLRIITVLFYLFDDCSSGHAVAYS
jgi:hypothetical protein